MIKQFNYPAIFKKQKDNGYLVQFIDLPEAITQGNTLLEAIEEAEDCLEEAIANRMAMKLRIPKPSLLKRSQRMISLPITLAAKLALYLALKEKHLTNLAFAKKLKCNEKEIRRLIDPYYQSKLPRIEHALNALGQRLQLNVAYL